MEAVGNSVLSTTLQMMFDRIALNKNILLGLFPGNKKLQLKRLMRVLQILSQFLQDAENKQLKCPAVKSWFNSLKHAVYQADDVLDEINTSLKQTKGHLSDTDFSDQFIGELSPSLEEICEALERKVQQIGVLGLEILHGNQKREDKRVSTSVVIQSQICGRDDEKEKIIQMVLSGEVGTQISVIPITGMGGIGKTTLAQLVYNDERVKNHFQTRAWVCVSEEFDVYRVTKDLLMKINVVVQEEDDLNHLQVKLEDNLKGNRFIIILDDIWNDNYNDCQHLMTPLNSGSQGSKIIVTTRNENIASMLQNEPLHRVKPISDDQSWSLFKLHAFDNRVRPQEFVTLGKTMAKRCKGLPLALKTVAGALRSKEDIREWRDIASNDNWMAEGDILPALSLSYKLLPSHLKCCFAFCAVFPKDVPFDKEETVQLWMANDLVQPSCKKVAENYFEELRSRSFFEMSNDMKYLMHDLINDLARYVSGHFCAVIEDFQLGDLHSEIQKESDLPQEIIHFSYLSSHDTLKKFRGLDQVQGLRTFLSVLSSWDMNFTSELCLEDILPKIRHIRALSLRGYDIFVIPDSIGDLKHLRFLNLGINYVRKLPNSITKCLNLQTLILAGSVWLEELPEDMGLLINLQHLDVRDVGEKFIANIEIWLSKLKHIQNLSIVVDEIHGNALDQLDKLQLNQDFTISLIHLMTVEMAKNAELKNKNCIEKLILSWRGQWDDIPECLDDLNIFSELRPDTNIRELEIKEYRGTTFPNWVGDSSFCNLESLTFDFCKIFLHLPPLSQLSSLRRLVIEGCSEMECFPNGGLPPSLEELHIQYCRKLIKFPRNWGLQRLPSLIRLYIEGIKDKLFPEEGLLPATLQRLHIDMFSNLEALNPKGFQDITSLQELEIWNCTELRCLPDGLPSSLVKLFISCCNKLEGRLGREKGEDWPKISHIPFIEVNGRRI